MKKWIINSLFVFASLIHAQDKDKLLAKGNEEFKEKKYITAETNYRKSQAKNPLSTTSAYNLGNTVYALNQPSEAKYAYAKVIESSKDKTEKHRAFHNLGNVFMKEKKYSEAVEAYKNALRNNPHDEETRYNYALAKKMLKDNPEENKKDDKDNKKQDDKKDDKQKDKDDKKEGDKKDDKSKNDKDKNQDKQPKKGEDKPEEGKFSKQRMESLLEAVNNEEKNIQEKVNKQKVKANPHKQEKDW